MIYIQLRKPVPFQSNGSVIIRQNFQNQFINFSNLISGTHIFPFFIRIAGIYLGTRIR
ncbi:MAG: hypothetical protein ACD_78C00456G0003 [uncultured bacterium (gcode 4)]|uniref:Uncharacterized protein n=1 Tax=uncultured bacterium (gcode 4) TaxID=1234023 RepID=K1XGB2_9BACT|nr:MAG: hypothetical protein ACD_78C00456G0003 [uncultured bacterium (gcode 4)]